MRIDRLDHFVLTVRDIDATVAFYQRVMGMEPVTFAGGRRALAFGRQKINLHPAAAPYEPRAAAPMPGSADVCFIASTPLAEVIAHLQRERVAIELGPTARTGALGPMMSVYFRDPDANLIEVSNYDDPANR